MIWEPNEPAVIKHITVLWTAGHSAGEIAKTLTGATRNAVIGKVHRMGLARSPDALVASRAKPSTKKPPKLRMVKAVKEPRPPKPVVIVVPAIPAPVIDISNARPWLERAVRQCAYLLDDGAACCGGVQTGSAYCPGHHRLVYRSTSSASAFARSLRKYA